MKLRNKTSKKLSRSRTTTINNNSLLELTQKLMKNPDVLNLVKKTINPNKNELREFINYYKQNRKNMKIMKQLGGSKHPMPIPQFDEIIGPLLLIVSLVISLITFFKQVRGDFNEAEQNELFLANIIDEFIYSLK
jgi:hypothetical protein